LPRLRVGNMGSDFIGVLFHRDSRQLADKIENPMLQSRGPPGGPEIASDARGFEGEAVEFDAHANDPQKNQRVNCIEAALASTPHGAAHWPRRAIGIRLFGCSLDAAFLQFLMPVDISLLHPRGTQCTKHLYYSRQTLRRH